MEAELLFKKLNMAFITPALSDDWTQDMYPISDFLTDNFKKRSMGLVCDNSPVVNMVYTEQYFHPAM